VKFLHRAPPLIKLENSAGNPRQQEKTFAAHSSGKATASNWSSSI
jgi:hypothetical protein